MRDDADVCDVSPILSQHCVNVSCLLGRARWVVEQMHKEDAFANVVSALEQCICLMGEHGFQHDTGMSNCIPFITKFFFRCGNGRNIFEIEI